MLNKCVCVCVCVCVFGHSERMGNEEFVKKVYISSVEGTNRRGRPLVRWDGMSNEFV